MPVNWTSGKRKLAQKKLRHKRATRSSNEWKKATWKSGPGLAVQGVNLSMNRKRGKRDILRPDDPSVHIQEKKTLSCGSSDIHGFQNQAKTLKTKGAERNLYKKVPVTNDGWTTGTEKKRQALLATTDWVGLFYRAGISSSARAGYDSARFGYRSTGRSAVGSRTGTELAPVEWGTNEKLDDRSLCSEPASSSCSSVFDTSRLVPSKPSKLAAMPDEPPSLPVLSPSRSFARSSRSNHSQPSVERSSEMSHSTARSLVSTPSPMDECQTGKLITMQSTTTDVQFPVPTWILRISHALGFSPPTGMSEFEHQRALQAEENHKETMSQGLTKDLDCNPGSGCPLDSGSEPDPLEPEQFEADSENAQLEENADTRSSPSLHVREPHDDRKVSGEQGKDVSGHADDSKDGSERIRSKLSLWKKLDVNLEDQLRLKFDDDQLFRT